MSAPLALPTTLTERFTAVAEEIADHPQVAFEETVAQAALSTWLQDEGFAVEAVPALPTAFVARAGRGRPTVAMLLEYDALPGVGHGCGHHLIGAGGALAAILAARTLRDGAQAGSAVAVGCPAEESGGGKALLERAGVFDDIDATMMFHPASRTLLARSALAATSVTVDFHGAAAHASKTPEHGRNALSAMVSFFTAVDALRPRLGTWARVNGIITHGGTSTGVVPDHTRAELSLREATLPAIAAVIDGIRACAEGAALSTGTTATLTEHGPAYAERRNNRVMLRQLAQHLATLDVPVDAPDVAETLGSSDVGNVSLVVPTIHPTIRIVDDPVPSHTTAFASAARQPLAYRSTLAMAQAQSMLMLDLLLQPELLAAAQEEFARGGFDPPGTSYTDLPHNSSH